MSRISSRGIVATTLLALLATAGHAAPKTPLMGWASFNTYRVTITEDDIKRQADAMVSSGLAAAGYKYINIDDGFFDGRNLDGSLKLKSERFPSGFKALVDYIHAKGLKAGFYSEAGANTCASIWDHDAGGRGAGLAGHEKQDLDLALKTWGFDYIKVDYCGALETGMDEETRFTAIGKAIQATGRTDVVYNICRWQFPGGWVAGVGNSWRIAKDIFPVWNDILRILDANQYLSAFSSPGHYNDMDMLEVGNGSLTEDENRAHFALWSLFSSPLVLGNDLTVMKPNVKAILTNAEVIALNQDTFGIQAVRVRDDGNGGEAYAKRLGGFASKERGVVLLNRSGSKRTVSVRWRELDLEGAATVRDLWAGKDLGSFRDSFSVEVPSHGAAALKIAGAASKLQETFEAEHAWMNTHNWTKGTQVQPGQAIPFADPTCSNGSKVRNLGNGAANYLEFNKVYAPSAGTYRATLVFQSGEDRWATMSVNGKDTVLTRLNSGSFGTRDSVTVPVLLKAGLNAIRFANATAPLPDMDAIRIDLNAAPAPVGLAAPLSRDAAGVRLLPRGRDGLLLETDVEFSDLRILDLSGKELWTGSDKRIPTGFLRPGLYLLAIRAHQGAFVKEFTRL